MLLNDEYQLNLTSLPGLMSAMAFAIVKKCISWDYTWCYLIVLKNPQSRIVVWCCSFRACIVLVNPNESLLPTYCWISLKLKSISYLVGGVFVMMICSDWYFLVKVCQWRWHISLVHMIYWITKPTSRHQWLLKVNPFLSDLLSDWCNLTD